MQKTRAHLSQCCRALTYCQARGMVSQRSINSEQMREKSFGRGAGNRRDGS